MRARLRALLKRVTRKAPPREAGPLGTVYALVRTWNRPLHLWACLDSLYRATRHPCRFVLLDNGSDDPLVHEVIRGFERRGMFHAVHRMERNHAANQAEVWALHRAGMGRYVVLIDGDTAVERTEPCWLERLLGVAERHARIGLLGTAVDTSDFVDPEWARSRAPDLPDEVLGELVKARSPERRQPRSSAEIMQPYPPAGRLLLARTQVLDQTGPLIGNRRLCAAVEAAGWEVGIATSVTHRHLSLLNFFDYPDYDFRQLGRYLQGV